MEGKLYYDKASGRYSFSYKDSDGELQDYGGIHCGEGFEVLLNDVWCQPEWKCLENGIL
jgi:hypothetical protein